MLDGDGVYLEPLGVEGITDEYVAWLNDPATFRFLGTKFGQTRSSVRAYVESFTPPNVLCRIVLKSTSEHVGNLALHMFDAIHRRMELGIMIGSAQARGKGVGRTACRLILDYGFRHLNLHKITSGTVADNHGMRQVLESLRFRLEGTLVEHYALDGAYVDIVRYGLLSPEYFRGEAGPEE